MHGCWERHTQRSKSDDFSIWQKKSFMIPKSLKQQNRGQNCVVNIEEILHENLHEAHVRNY